MKDFAKTPDFPEPPRRRLQFPFKIFFLLAFGAIAFLFVFIMTKALVPSKEAQPGGLLVKEKQAVVVTPRPTETPLPLGYGTVIIQTEPADAKIYVNEALISSKSPAKLERQSNQGAYRLAVERRGYEPYTKIYNVEANQRMIIHVRLQKSPPTKKPKD
ncbi:MAG: PEGA domain-containing protein [Pseudomonadota bacterium]